MKIKLEAIYSSIQGFAFAVSMMLLLSLEIVGFVIILNVLTVIQYPEKEL